MKNAILEGLHYVRRSPILFWLALLLLLFNFILPTADVQIVWYAKQWLRASDAQIGLLYASDGTSKRIWKGIGGKTLDTHFLLVYYMDIQVIKEKKDGSHTRWSPDWRSVGAS